MKMTYQTIWQFVGMAALVVAAVAGWRAGVYGDRESDSKQRDLKSQIASLQAYLGKKIDLLIDAKNVKQDVWVAVKTDTVPPTAAYLMLLFKSDKGRISGKVRVQGSERIASFSTTANDTTPIAVANLWLPKERQYRMPIIVEFAVTEKTVADANLSVFTQGWIDDLGQEPH